MSVAPALLHAECDLRVAVFGYDGKPKDAMVRILKEQSDWSLESMSAHGVAEFCDVGLGLFRVAVGSNTCGQVTVRLLQIHRDKTIYLPVFYENCHGFSISAGCEVLVRVVNHKSEPIVSASVVVGKRNRAVDEYGRIILGVGEHPRQVIVEAPGFTSRTLLLACDSQGLGREYSVVLKP